MTSCHPSEGKSFVTMNLARSMGLLGKRTVFVDADIRASVLQRKYGIQLMMQDESRYEGLTGYLAGKAGVDDVLAATNVPNVHMILSGHNVINSLPLLNSSRLKNLMDTLARSYDIVLIDAPPIGSIIDAARISTVCDGTMFVIESGEVSHGELREAMQQIEKAGCPILGTVLNKFDEKEFGSKYYHKSSYYSKYGYGYGPAAGNKGKAKSNKFVNREKTE